MPKQFISLTPTSGKTPEELAKEVWASYQAHKNPVFYTAESVSPKHPDKLCDQISDAILDAYLEKDPSARVAVETVGGHGKLLIIGEVTSSTIVHIPKIATQFVDTKTEIEVKIVKQSPEIAHGVDSGGAGDQGIMVGYACNETPEFLPLEVVLSRRLNQYLYEKWPYDGKTQVTLKNDAVHSIIASFQNADARELALEVQKWIKNEPLATIKDSVSIHANPAGNWQQGGFDADTGLTGRKLVVDNYGPRVPIGGGCFSGKDPSKVDRSAAYMARKIAIDYLKKRNAREVFCHLAYAIGKAEPEQATVTIDGAQEDVNDYDLTPNGIIKFLNLKQPVYQQTASYGHFGHKYFSWER